MAISEYDRKGTAAMCRKVRQDIRKLFKQTYGDTAETILRQHLGDTAYENFRNADYQTLCKIRAHLLAESAV